MTLHSKDPTTYLGWEKGCVLEVLDEGTCEEGAKEEDDGKKEDVRHIFTGVGEDAHEPWKKRMNFAQKKSVLKVLTEGEEAIPHSLQCFNPSRS